VASGISGPSKNQVVKAGKLLRKYRRGELDPLTDEVAKALLNAVDVAQAWRKTFAVPLQGVRMGLESFIRTCDVDGAVTQRHKRLPRIAQKLARDNITMPLTAMQDIGGCRVVVPGLHQLRQLEAHIRKRWGANIKNLDDYVSDPPSSGYRAVHIVVMRKDRLIEVQLRTESQQDWADDVERLGRRTGFELKAGQGPSELLHVVRVAADLMACEEAGYAPAEALLAEWEEARRAATPFMG